MERCVPRPAANRRRHASQRRTPIRICPISPLGFLCRLATLPEMGETGRKPSCFHPQKAGSKKSLEFFFSAPCNFFSPGLSF
jgi:hypothetical protein